MKSRSTRKKKTKVTAAAFTKGFLDLVGDLTPILVSMVTTSKTAQDLLDEPIPKESRERVKKKIDSLLHTTDLSRVGQKLGLPNSAADSFVSGKVSTVSSTCGSMTATPTALGGQF